MTDKSIRMAKDDNNNNSRESSIISETLYNESNKTAIPLKTKKTRARGSLDTRDPGSIINQKGSKHWHFKKGDDITDGDDLLGWVTEDPDCAHKIMVVVTVVVELFEDLTGVESVGAVRPRYECTGFVANEVGWLHGLGTKAWLNKHRPYLRISWRITWHSVYYLSWYAYGAHVTHA